MKREVCKLNMTVVNNGDETTTSVACGFEGNGEELADVLAHILKAFELSPKEAALLCSVAVARLSECQEVDE